MRAPLSMIVFVVLSISISTAVVPLQSAVPEIQKSSCCAKMKTSDQQDDCGKHFPKSRQEQQCCAGCTIGLALFLNAVLALEPLPPDNESFAGYICDEHVRKERPPVPPPRPAAA